MDGPAAFINTPAIAISFNTPDSLLLSLRVSVTCGKSIRMAERFFVVSINISEAFVLFVRKSVFSWMLSLGGRKRWIVVDGWHDSVSELRSFIGPGPRYPGPRGPGVRMPQQVEFNAPGNVPGQPMMPGGMDPSRQGPSGMSPMNPRMNPPRGQPMGPINPGNYGGMRPPSGGMGPSGPQMSPMSMPGPGGRPWNPNTSNMNYSSSSPGSHYGGPPVSSSGGQGPGTPIMPSPQGSGPDGMYTMMKPVPGGNMPGFPMGPGPDGPMGSMGPDMGPPVLNGISSGDGMEGMKNSPATGPGTPREDGPQMGDYGIPNYGQDNYQLDPSRST
ncbi:hypothetical protein JTE90_004329 [Oedothorax gibbosus]|uniref:Single-stranded DNA-binding protein 3 n=1 Tax=Oedothorax gibbosus TaxID=931172 RepID=A0AAV6VKA3_9ARAC|nr:hypothetical protein JTE90_004329 [Oedothorax gibbosus]